MYPGSWLLPARADLRVVAQLAGLRPGGPVTK